MALELIGTNKNTFGNNGQFEKDRSTWGFPDNTEFEMLRSGTLATAGLYSARCRAKTTQTGVSATVQGAAAFLLDTKTYIAKAKVRTPTATPVAADAAVISLYEASGDLTITMISKVDTTVLACKDAWVDIELRFSVSGFIGAHYPQLRVNAPAGLIMNGLLYVDQFEIYEYIIVADVPPLCDVEIDPDTTVVVDESAPAAANGSIDVIATGTGTLEYSKDGSTWQLAHLFSGLVNAIYLMRVRRQAEISCVKLYPFAVNDAAVTHDFTTLVTPESIAGIHDGAISINVTGTGGPFEYSIDAGVTWQAGNNFPSLAPGTYFVAVRNAAGNSVVHVVELTAGTIEFDKIYHSKNPITFSKAAAPGWEALTNYRLFNDVRVEEVADSGNYNSKLKVELPLDASNQATFYLQQAFRGGFTFVPPTLNHSTIIRITDRIKRYKNYSGELENNEIEPAEVDLEISAANIAIWGGVSKYKFPGLNYFTSYLPTNKKFLTWAPIEKSVDRQQEDYLNFWNYGNYIVLKLQIKAYFDDATDETDIVTTLTGTRYSELYQVPAGPANSGVLLINPAKNVTHYELSMLDQDDELISEVRTYYIETVRHPLTRFFMFLNSLGAFEVLKFTGQTAEKTQFSRDLVQKFLPHNYAALDGQFVVNQITRKKQRSLSSGYIKGRFAREWHEYLEDFIGSPVVYDITDGLRYPILITSGSLDTEDQNYERFIRVEARDAYDNDSYTPAAI